MTIVYKLDAQGGFTVADAETRHTAYAYPTSPHAVDARRNPEGVADAMALSANAFAAVCPSDIVARCDERNWRTLEADRRAAA